MSETWGESCPGRTCDATNEQSGSRDCGLMSKQHRGSGGGGSDILPPRDGDVTGLGGMDAGDSETSHRRKTIA